MTPQWRIECLLTNPSLQRGPSRDRTFDLRHQVTRIACHEQVPLSSIKSFIQTGIVTLYHMVGMLHQGSNISQGTRTVFGKTVQIRMTPTVVLLMAFQAMQYLYKGYCKIMMYETH